MEYLANYLLGQTNHWPVNLPNLYNFIIASFEDLHEDQRQTFINRMKLHLGMTITNELKTYIFRKDRKHPILEFI